MTGGHGLLRRKHRKSRTRKEKAPPFQARPLLQQLTSTHRIHVQNSTELVTAFSLATLLARLLVLTVRILLLLSGLLPATLLLAGLLPGILVLLAGVLVRIGHKRSPLFKVALS